jgi:hypothetical protein
VDVHLLRDQLTRLDPGAGTGLDDLPNLPLIDTSTLPRLLRLDGAAGRPALGLAVLCNLLGVANTSPHHARHDARATAAALVKLLVHAASRLTYGDIDELLADHDRGTAREPHISTVTQRRTSSEPGLPDAHLARHTQPLLDPATTAELDAWKAGAAECVRLRCRHLADAAELAARENGPAVLHVLTSLIRSCDQPGQAGTLLGAIKRVVAVTDATTPPITAQLTLRWLAQHQVALAATPACAGHSGADECPDCRDQVGCPRDTLHHPFVQIATLGLVGTLTESRIKDRLLGKTPNRSDRALNMWGDQRNVAHMMWLVITWEREQYLMRKAATHLRWAIDRDLHLIEPRLALLACIDWAEAGQVNDARSLAIDAVRSANTDPAYADLRNWLAHTDAQDEVRTREVSRKPITHPRLARPVGRTNPNPYRVG